MCLIHITHYHYIAYYFLNSASFKLKIQVIVNFKININMVKIQAKKFNQRTLVSPIKLHLSSGIKK